MLIWVGLSFKLFHAKLYIFQTNLAGMTRAVSTGYLSVYIKSVVFERTTQRIILASNY